MDFERGIEKLRIKLHKNDMKEIFMYLDVDKDKFLNYMEFSKLNQNSSFTSRFPGKEHSIHNSSHMDTRLSTRARSNDIRKNNATTMEDPGKWD